MTKKTLQFLTAAETAARIGLTPGTLAVYRMRPAFRAQLPHYKTGRLVEYLESDVLAYLANRRRKVGP